METPGKPVQNGRGRKRRWSAEQKLALLQEWKNGVPLEEVCRKFDVDGVEMDFLRHACFQASCVLPPARIWRSR